MPTIKLDKGTTARTFAPPPPKFNPLKASPRELTAYGFPARPKEPQMLRRWTAQLSRPVSVVQPRFRPLARAPQKLPKKLAPPALPAMPPPMRTNYIGGGTATAPAASGTFRWIEGTFTVPNIYPPSGGDSDGYPFSAWVGIFGADSTSSLLAGWDSTVYWTGRDLKRSTYVWWRWEPADANGVSNFFLDPGDTIGFVICLDLGSVVRARLTFFNKTTSQATTFVATAPSGTELEGDTAGWLVSNGVYDFNGPFIARFGEMFIDECNAGTTDSPAILNPTQMIYLTDFEDTTKDVVVASVRAPTLLQLGYVGP
jgi:hypothetical protein